MAGWGYRYLPKEMQRDFVYRAHRTWRLCRCGKPEETCRKSVEEHAAVRRAQWAEQVAACLKDPKWVDPAPFPVPKAARYPAP